MPPRTASVAVASSVNDSLLTSRDLADEGTCCLGALQTGRAKLRRRNATRPATVRTAEIACRLTTGTAVTSAAGAFGMWVNGDRFCTHCGNCRVAAPNNGPRLPTKRR